MKGIAGIVYQNVFQVGQLIHPMLESLKHRGVIQPVHTFKNIQIGNCGEPLFFYGKRKLIGIIDGYLTNAAEIKKELEKVGYSFTTNRQEEILLYGYELWEKEIFERIAGFFAILILDQEKEKIFLARDRIGKKNLYWFHDQHHFIFGSELKALMATGAIPQTPAYNVLGTYLYFGFLPQDMAPIKDVSKLLPGHYLQLNRDKSKTIEPYWSYSNYFQTQAPQSKEDVIKHLDDLICDSFSCIEKGFSPNASIGCLISGGLGSATIAYYLKKTISNERIRAFSVGFEGENDEDIIVAQEVAKTLQLPHRTLRLNPHNFLNEFVKIAWYLDEPLADPNVIATWNLAKISSEQVHLVFSGMGSDELFAGHSRYTIAEQQISFTDQLVQRTLPPLNRFLGPILNMIYQPAALALARKSKKNPWHFDYLKQNALFDEKMISTAAPRLSGLFDAKTFLHKFYHLSRINSPVGSMLYFDIKTRLPDLFILQFERLTAAHQLKWYAPLLDSLIVQFLASLPEPTNLKESDTAYFLKPLLQNTFPQFIIDRPKRTRKRFLNNWIEISDLKKIFQDLPKGALVEAGLISEKWLKEHVQNEQSRKIYFRNLWAIFALEVWFRLYIIHPIQTSSPEMGILELLSEGK